MNDSTKGDWKVIEGYNGIKDIVRSDSGFVASTQFRRPKGENEANAHLIAAAPDLYEALKYFYTHFLTFIEDVKPGTWINLDDYFSPQDRGKLEDVKQALSKAKPNVEW